MARRYYSIRTGKHPHGNNIPLPVLASLLYTAYGQLAEAGYFQEHFGYGCVDAGDVPGKLGAMSARLYSSTYAATRYGRSRRSSMDFPKTSFLTL